MRDCHYHSISEIKSQAKRSKPKLQLQYVQDATKLPPIQELDVVTSIGSKDFHLCSSILWPKIQRPDGNSIEQQLLCTVLKDKSRSMKDWESRNKTNEEHM
jgi:hypothetical protein